MEVIKGSQNLMTSLKVSICNLYSLVAVFVFAFGLGLYLYSLTAYSLQPFSR